MMHLLKQHWPQLKPAVRIGISLALLFIVVEGVLMRLTIL